jgi:hypothetical protein
MIFETRTEQNEPLHFWVHSVCNGGGCVMTVVGYVGGLGAGHHPHGRAGARGANAKRQ